MEQNSDQQESNRRRQAEKSRSKKGLVILIILLFVSVVAASLWSYQKQKKQIESQNQKIETQQSEIKDKDNKIKELENQDSQNSGDAAGESSNSGNSSAESANTYLDIKEFKIKLKLDDNIKDAYYEIESLSDESGRSYRVAYLSTRTLTAKDPECSPSKTSSGAIEEDGGFTGPQAICADGSINSLEEAIANSFAKAAIVKY